MFCEVTYRNWFRIRAEKDYALGALARHNIGNNVLKPKSLAVQSNSFNANGARVRVPNRM